MQRDAAARQQSRPGQQIAARVQGTDQAGLLPQPPQPAQSLGAALLLRVKTGVDDQVARPGYLLQIQMALQRHAVAGVHRGALFAQALPAVERAATELIGDAQGLNGRQQGDHGVVRQQQKGDGHDAIVVGDETGIGGGDHAAVPRYG